MSRRDFFQLFCMFYLRLIYRKCAKEKKNQYLTVYQNWNRTRVYFELAVSASYILVVIRSNQRTSVHIDCSSRALKLQQVAACSQVLLDESTPSCPSSQKTEKKGNQEKIFVFGKHVIWLFVDLPFHIQYLPIVMNISRVPYWCWRT